MASLVASSSARVCGARRTAVRVQAVAKPSSSSSSTVKNEEAQMKEFKQAALATVAGNMLLAGHANAATEVATVAGDNRIAMLASLSLPLAGWVLFNIAGPAKKQLDGMRMRGLVGAMGLAGLLAAGSADAAQEIVMTAGDNRVGILLTLFVPLAGWVLFNIGGPALNQLNNMRSRSIAGGVGLAGLLAAGNADAAQEIATTAGDNRVGILLTLFLPLAGWVLFNIGGPALNQLNNMRSRSIAGGVGLAGLLAASNADAAQEIATTAGDNRVGILLTLFVPLAGWVLFNIGGPALNQLNNMRKK